MGKIKYLIIGLLLVLPFIVFGEDVIIGDGKYCDELNWSKNIILDSDYVTDGVCGSIDRSDFTIDCKGHSITGLNDGTTGIVINGGARAVRQKIVIKNCVFKDLGMGVFFDFVDNSSIENSNFINNSLGLSVFLSNDNEFIDLTFDKNDRALDLHTSSDNTFSQMDYINNLEDTYVTQSFDNVGVLG